MKTFKNRKAYTDWKRRNTVPGYLKNMFVGLKQKAEKRKIPFHIKSFEEFYELFFKHVQKFGMCCEYSGELMTVHRFYKKGINYQNVSVDRLDNTKGYTRDNIVFTTGAMNKRKSAVTIDDCKNILKVYNKRNQS